MDTLPDRHNWVVAQPPMQDQELFNMDPEIILHHGKIATLANGKPEVEAVSITAGKFSSVGRDEEIFKFAGHRTQRIDLGGRRVIPGLNDSHLHLIRGGLNYNMELRWDGVPSLADAL